MDLPVNYTTLSSSGRKIVREEYIKVQQGLCSYCNAPLTGPPRKDIQEKKVTTKLFPPNFFTWPIHLHHDHNTNMTKGAVHCYCNAVLWEYDGE